VYGHPHPPHYQGYQSGYPQHHQLPQQQTNPYANYQQNTSQISLGGATFGSEETAQVPQKQNKPSGQGVFFYFMLDGKPD
jgi:hypothetical protein